MAASFGDRFVGRCAQLQRIIASDLKEFIEKLLSYADVPDHNKAIVCSAMDSPLSSQLINAIPADKGLFILPQ